MVDWKHKPSWDDAPEWASYLVVSKKGWWVWFEKHPEWRNIAGSPGYALQSDPPGINLHGKYCQASREAENGFSLSEAKRSLEKRPEPAVNPDWPELDTFDPSKTSLTNTSPWVEGFCADEPLEVDLNGINLNGIDFSAPRVEFDLDAAATHFQIDDIPAPAPGTPAGTDPAHGFFVGDTPEPPVAEEAAMDVPGYEQLAAVLLRAYDQAARGKGKERHANDLPFHEQPIQVISDLLNNPGGLSYQAIKKIQEGMNMPQRDRKVKELLGAIVYLSALIMWVEKQPEVEDSFGSVAHADKVFRRALEGPRRDQ